MRKILTWIGLGILAVIVVAVAVLAFYPPQYGTMPASPRTQTVTLPTDLRDYPYCEFIPIFQWGVKLNAEVYNTLTANECPADAWAAIENTGAKALARQYGATLVVLNGPRHWVLDGIHGSDNSAHGKVIQVGSLQFIQRATIPRYLWTPNTSGNYSENTVDRHTVYNYFAGSQIYELVAPSGKTYIMQTDAQIVDPQLTIDQLATLGTRLKLPQGWAYKTCVLSQEFDLTTNGTATVLQDDLQNSYQALFASEPAPVCG